MSLTPSTPNIPTKSFWSRPEGTFGKWLLGAFALGGAAAIWFMLLPFLLEMVWGTVELVVAGIILFALIYIATDKTIRKTIGVAYKLFCRWLTGKVIELDPIGILRENIKAMQRNFELLSTQVGRVRGAVEALLRAIRANAEQIDKNNGMIKQAQKAVLGVRKGSLEEQRFSLTIQTNAQSAGRLMKSNEKLNRLLSQAQKLYDLLVRYRELTGAVIADRTDQANQLAQERKVITAAYEAMGTAKRILAGDPEQQDMINSTLEYLADDTAQKLGLIEDFAQYSEHFLTDMDLANGADADHALAELSKYEQKLLTAGSSEPIPTSTVIEGQYEPVPAKRNTTETNSKTFDDVDDLLK